MHAHSPHRPRIFLIARDGKVSQSYDSLLEAAAALLPQRYREWSKTGIKLGEFHDGYPFGYTWSYSRDHELVARSDYVLRDDCGRHLSWNDLEQARAATLVRRPFWSHRYEGYEHDRDYRRGPVPGVHKRRWWHASSKRTRTGAPELRAWEALVQDEDAAEVGLRPRAKRREVLARITDWDSVCRSDYRDKNWKRHRAKQWRA